MHKRIPVTRLDVWVSSSAVRSGFSAGKPGQPERKTKALNERDMAKTSWYLARDVSKKLVKTMGE